MLRAFIASLFALALALPAVALDFDSMSEEERAAFGTAVREYLLENPQVIMEAVQVLEQRQSEAQAEADQSLVADNAEAIFNDGHSYVGGNPDGDVTLVEFLDYRCGYCKRAHPEVAKLLETDGNIRLIVKEFPILGDQSVLASRFAIAAKQIEGDEAYKALSDALMEFSGDITIPTLERMANTMGLDAEAITAQMTSDEVTEVIQENRALAQRLNISGTPTFVLEDELLRGYLPYDQMSMIVDDKRG
jgi:protein-disulfide isomerase